MMEILSRVKLCGTFQRPNDHEEAESPDPLLAVLGHSLPMWLLTPGDASGIPIYQLLICPPPHFCLQKYFVVYNTISVRSRRIIISLTCIPFKDVSAAFGAIRITISKPLGSNSTKLLLPELHR